jgi:hypothetical protein
LAKVFLAGSADRTGPVVGNVFELGSGGDAAVRVTDGWVVNIAAEGANILVHIRFSL